MIQLRTLSTIEAPRSFGHSFIHQLDVRMRERRRSARCPAMLREPPSAESQPSLHAVQLKAERLLRMLRRVRLEMNRLDDQSLGLAVSL